MRPSVTISVGLGFSLSVALSIAVGVGWPTACAICVLLSCILVFSVWVLSTNERTERLARLIRASHWRSSRPVADTPVTKELQMPEPERVGDLDAGDQ
jgi:hypothetical protein